MKDAAHRCRGGSGSLKAASVATLAKAAADPAGHYARPDVTRLLLDRTPGDRVIARQARPAEVVRAGDDEPTAARTETSELPNARRAA